MSISNTNFLLFVTILMVGIMAMNVPKVVGQSSLPPILPGLKKGCLDMFDFIKYCAIYMHTFSPPFHKPNEKCCASARKKYMIKLFCKVFVLKETEKVFNPAKLAVVASHCGNPLPRGTRCGSYIVH